MRKKTCQILWIFVLLAMVACDSTTTKTVDSCGDGVVDPGEDCEGDDLGGETCISLGYERGTLACDSTCRFERSGCEVAGFCGDGQIQESEACDGGELGGQTCATQGYYSGTLACGDDCQFDLGNCDQRCGDGTVDDAHQEVCDGTNLNGWTCEDFGYYGPGALACAADCRSFVEAGCEVEGWCGDDTTQETDGEACDGTDLNGHSCETLGYYGGALGCTDDCGFDLDGCITEGRCGDGIVQIDSSETCDGVNLNGRTCEDFGYYGPGALACAADCRSFVEAGCEGEGWCGDDITQETAGEACDGTDLNGQTCESLGYHAGTLGCATDCSLDLADCVSEGRCGDGIVQATFGEVCDGVDFDGQSCMSLGYHGGALGCSDDCELVLTDCISEGRCGDGILQANYGEQCEDANLNGETCVSRGYLGGTLTCASCAFVTTGCWIWTSLDTGSTHTCGIRTGGTAWCWGDNIIMQLGDGTTTERLIPTQVSGLIAGVTAISAGFGHTCAIVNGAAKCWGYNHDGQLGDGTTTNRSTPTQVQGLTSGVTAISAGNGYTCAVVDGAAKCWGYNYDGQLGNGTTISRSTPGQVTGLLYVVNAISADEDHTCAVVGDSARCWGANYDGQLGDGTTTRRLTSAPVIGLASGVTAISAGSGHTCAIFNGAAKCWGANYEGQLGDGTTTNRLTATQVTGLSVVTAITAGGGHTCAIVDGAAKCWGENYFGQVGDGTTTNRLTPTQVSTFNLGAVKIGNNVSGHSCGIKENKIWCWGLNNYGQLGNGTKTNVSTPVMVINN